MKIRIFLILISGTLFLNGCGNDSGVQNKRTILVVVDGLASGAIEKLRLVHLQNWKKEGCFYNSVFAPLPAFPENDSTYQWSCPVPDPAMMTGTVFIGQNNIKRSMIQNMFGNQNTAFVVNSDLYSDIAKDFDFYFDMKSGDEDIYKDEIVFNKAKEVIEDDNPSFVKLHLQGPDKAGEESNIPANKDNKWYHNIWDENSPYGAQLKKDDQLIEEFINWLQYKGYWESTTMIVTGNYGQSDSGGHSELDINSCKTEMLILGKDVKSGAEFDYAEITDIAPTIIRINNLSPLQYADGRVLEEAFKWGPDSFSPERKMERLDNILINHQKTVNPSYMLKKGFQDIDHICEWHKYISPVSINEFIRYEEKI